MEQKRPLKSGLIFDQKHYVKRHKIEPSDVLDDWGFGHIYFGYVFYNVAERDWSDSYEEWRYENASSLPLVRALKFFVRPVMEGNLSDLKEVKEDLEDFQHWVEHFEEEVDRFTLNKGYFNIPFKEILKDWDIPLTSQRAQILVYLSDLIKGHKPSLIDLIKLIEGEIKAREEEIKEREVAISSAFLGETSAFQEGWAH